MPIRPKNMPEDMPAELMEAADERDGMLDEQLDSLIPSADSPFNVKVLAAMSEAIQAIASMMGIPVEIEAYDEPTTRIDEDVARFLFMASKAAEDYGKPFPVSLDAVRGDSGFKDFLMGDDEGDDESGEVEIEIRQDKPADDDADDLFMSRMR